MHTHLCADDTQIQGAGRLGSVCQLQSTLLACLVRGEDRESQ